MHNRVNIDNSKATNFKDSIKKLLNYNKSFLLMTMIATFLSIIASILSIISPDILKDITNIISQGLALKIDVLEIKRLGFILVIMYGVSFIFSYGQSLIMTSITNKFARKMRLEISDKINKVPLAYFDKTTIGNVLSQVTNDVDTIGQTLNQSFSPLIGSITMFFGSIIMMFITNWIMAITAIISSIIGFVLMSVILAKSQKYFVAVQAKLGEINGHIEQVYSGHNVVKVYNGAREVNDEFDKINTELYINGKKSQFYSGLMMPLMNFIGNFGYVSVCIVGAVLVVNNTISFGVIVAFMMYVRLFTQPLSQIAQSMTTLQSAVAASERVFNFLGEKEMSDESSITNYLDPKDVKGNIEFKNIKFGYDEDKLIINSFNAKIKSGQKIAIVGPTGAGKTTIVNLLMKFYELNSGQILIDNVPIKNLTRENIHDLFVMVLQDTWLFEGTIKENIVYNRIGVSDQEIRNVCKKVGLDHFIMTLPDGYETILGDDEAISAGQKQLLTIARCMLKKAPFLILDEATSSVDTRTEILVQEAFVKLLEEKTSFIIAHRLSTIKNADLILVMNEGNIIEQGNHEELLTKKGFYANLYNSQFENIAD